MLDMTYSDTWNTRKERLIELGMSSYEQYLESQYWKITKKKALKRPNYQKCEICGNSEVDLHHTSYNWLGTKFELRSINSFCRYHHSIIHELAKETGVSVRLCTNLMRDPTSKNSTEQVLSVNKEFFNIFKVKYS